MDGRFDISESDPVEKLFEFAVLLLSSPVLGKRGRTDSVTMPGPSRSAPDTTTESSGSSKKIKPETQIVPDYNKQSDFIKYWMFTSQLGPNTTVSALDACSAAVTAEFGSEALSLEQVRVFHSDRLYCPKFLPSHSRAR